MAALLAGAGAAVGIALLGWLGAFSALKLLIAPMGASCVLLYSAPASPLSQPVNVIGGHVSGALTGLFIGMVLPAGLLAPAIAVGLTIALMMTLRITHPLAGATALVAAATSQHQGEFFASVLLATVLLVGVTIAWHRFTGISYPLQPAEA
jgi:CBS-domain-containing membrane protein